MESRYLPQEIEEKIYRMWESENYFFVDAKQVKKKYVIVIPPPNITGFLHMGHALNNTIQDILIRWKRMEGYDALWVPGTDHAGIATQNVVEKELLKKGITRKELGREKFLDEVWKWKEKYGSRIIFQLKRLGASCDWSKIKFTMDESFSKAVVHAFVHLYKKGLIYKGKKIINWCPRCTTALSDEEVDYKDEEGYLYYIKYPLLDGGYIEVATTRPETMLGDTAVAIHPEDKRYKHLKGKKAILPFVNRVIPIIEDEAVEIEFGTGAVKVTPAHDPVDFEIGKRHNLEFVVVINEEGKMNENCGKFSGSDRFECRKYIVEELKKLNLLSRVEPYTHRVGHCYRCNTTIEPYLSSQWFVKMEPLARPAIEVAEKGELKFYPERWKKIYLNWLYNIKDWCISRQIWWGHRIPVWYCENKDCPPIVDYTRPSACPECGSRNLTQDSDVLDTWFSSWLWPFGVFGWPEKTEELEIFYPTDTLVTAQEIIFFWVARMVMAGLEFTGKLPFRNVYIHGTVRDKTGKKMSKSLGNVIDPIDIIDKCGADSLRFSLISLTAFGQDVFLPDDFYIPGRNFMNKIWNAARFIFNNAEEKGIKEVSFEREITESLKLPEKWILILLDELIEKVSSSLEEYRFNEALSNLYEFFWHRFCDWYIEISKVFINEKYFKECCLPVLLYTLSVTMKLLHPFIPFITEEIWQNLKKYFRTDHKTISLSKWPEKINIRDDLIIKEMDKVIEVVSFLRKVKSLFHIPLNKKILCFYDGKEEISEDKKRMILRLAGVEEISYSDKKFSEKNVISRKLSMGRFGVVLEGIIDFKTVIDKLEKEKEKLEEYKEKIKSRINNPEFLNKAPEKVIIKEREKIKELEEKIRRIKEDIDLIIKKES